MKIAPHPSVIPALMLGGLIVWTPMALNAEPRDSYKGRSSRSSGSRGSGGGVTIPRGSLDADMRREIERRLEENEDKVKDTAKESERRTPPDWAKWSQSERERWEKEREKYRLKLQETAKTRKGASEQDSKTAIAMMDSLVAQGVAPKDASAAVNGLMEKGFKADDLTKAFEGFGASSGSGAGDAAKSFDGGNLSEMLRGKLDDLMKGKGADLLDIFQGSGGSPAPSDPGPAPMPETDHDTPVEIVGGTSSDPATFVPEKDFASEAAPRKGKIR